MSGLDAFGGVLRMQGMLCCYAFDSARGFYDCLSLFVAGTCLLGLPTGLVAIPTLCAL